MVKTSRIFPIRAVEVAKLKNEIAIDSNNK